MPRRCDRCENTSHGFILVVKKRTIHQNVTGRKDGNYPGEVNEEEGGTICSGGVKILQGFVEYSLSLKKTCEEDSCFISGDHLRLLAELR